MSTKNLTETPVNATYYFQVGGERGKYQVSFTIDNKHLKTACTCKHENPCKHVDYILAGKTSRIVGGDTHKQAELIRAAQETEEGADIIRRARRKFAGETHCRRCSSERIVKLKHSLSARFFTFFKDTSNHSYYCRDCKWTW